jgi:hypothetical protein
MPCSKRERSNRIVLKRRWAYLERVRAKAVPEAAKKIGPGAGLLPLQAEVRRPADGSGEAPEGSQEGERPPELPSRG